MTAVAHNRRRKRRRGFFCGEGGMQGKMHTKGDGADKGVIVDRAA